MQLEEKLKLDKELKQKKVELCLSGRMRMVKWVRLYQNPNYKPRTPKQIERENRLKFLNKKYIQTIQKCG
jgi:hypothetical protein